jgi:hypothetical protein
MQPQCLNAMMKTLLPLPQTLVLTLTLFAAHETTLRAAPVDVVSLPPASGTNRFYIANRPPLAPSPFVKLPIGSIRPRGWLRHQLELERDGMTGRLAEISPWLNFEKSAWADKDGQGKYGWEEMPYWLKGFGDLGYVLGDEKIIAEAKKWIEAAMASQREDGWFGPRELLTGLKGKPDLWPHMVMLNVLQSYHEFTGDPRAIEVMTRYLRCSITFRPARLARGTGRRFAPATTSKAPSGFTIAPANRGCSSWPARSTRTWPRGTRTSSTGTT